MALKLTANVPVEVALEYATGKLVEGNYGPQMMYSLVGGEKMYLPLSVVELIDGLGVKRLEPVGQPFDPARHEAVTSVAAGAAAPGTVVGIVKPGYLIGDEVLRPAQVAVAGERG